MCHIRSSYKNVTPSTKKMVPNLHTQSPFLCLRACFCMFFLAQICLYVLIFKTYKTHFQRLVELGRSNETIMFKLPSHQSILYSLIFCSFESKNLCFLFPYILGRHLHFACPPKLTMGPGLYHTDTLSRQTCVVPDHLIT